MLDTVCSLWELELTQPIHTLALYILRCIRPPQNQSGPNSFLKQQCALMDRNIFIKQIGSIIFKTSALWADAFYKSKCPFVCLSVCLSVCVFTFEVPFKRLFFPHFPKSDVGSGLRLEHFCLEVV